VTAALVLAGLALVAVVGVVIGAELRPFSRLLNRRGFVVVPLPPSAKMLREHANVCESQHLRGDVHGSTDGCVVWMRAVASKIEDVR
jgi:hypothetical protein